MAYTKAREALRIATDKYGMSYEDIAGLCDVNLGTVKRWMSNGRADEKAIRPLIDQIGTVYLTASQVAEHLKQLFKAKRRTNNNGEEVRRFRITNYQLQKISGRQRLKAAFTNELVDEMEIRGFLFVQGTDDFILVSWKWFYNSCAVLDDKELREYYIDLADEIEEED